MGKAVRLGIAGLGTVGVGVIRLVRDNASLLASRSGASLEVSAVGARDATKDRGIDLSGLAWESDAVALAMREDVDVFVELIGGSDGKAYDSVTAALKAGKTVVTANKALVAVHGIELAGLVEQHDGKLYYEAAVAGGIPAIKVAREGLAANQINSVYGILNGTCNYILTRMESDKESFDDVLADAIKLGYAEAEPSVDVDGWDAAHKLAILASICFGGAPDMDALSVDGIRKVTLDTIEMADELGYKVKLLGVANGQERSFVAACAVPKSSSIAGVDSSFNAVVFNGDPVDEVMIRGRGAGEGPTASAVVADIVDFARGIEPPLFGNSLQSNGSDLPEPEARQMIALNVVDQPGVIASISEGLSQVSISVESMLQRAGSDGKAKVLIVTHPTNDTTVSKAVELLAANTHVESEPLFLRVVEG